MGHALLDLKPTAKHPLEESLIGQQLSSPEYQHEPQVKWQKMVFTKAVEFDIADNDHVLVFNVKWSLAENLFDICVVT